MMDVILVILFVLFGCVTWRLRGGAWNTWLHIHMGTVATRIVTGALYAVPVSLVVGNVWLLLTITLGVWVGLMLAGWGPFMTMGQHENPPKKTWIEIIPTMLGIKPTHGVAYDFVGMMACGVLLFTPITLSMLLLGSSGWMLCVVGASAVLFATIYLFWSKQSQVPQVPGFASGFTEWAEFTVGGLVSLMLITLLMIL